jgi:hypothetical protein
MLRLVIGFLPWIILGVLGNRWFVLALSLSLAAAAVTTVRQIRGRSLKILDTTTFAFFLFVLVGVFGFHWMILATYMSLLVNVTLTAIASGSLLADSLPHDNYLKRRVSGSVLRRFRLMLQKSSAPVMKACVQKAAWERSAAAR